MFCKLDHTCYLCQLGKLQCATEEVANRCFMVNVSADPVVYPSQWMRECMAPSNSVIFLDTDFAGDEAMETIRDGRVSNDFEAVQIARLVQQFVVHNQIMIG